MNLTAAARRFPDHAALVIAGRGEVVSYADLDRRSNRVAHLLRELGLRRGDAIGLMVDNRAAFFDICCAAARAGLYFTPISTSLTGPEVAYIFQDSGAKAVFVAQPFAAAAIAARAETPSVAHWFSVGGEIAGFTTLEAATQTLPDSPIADESLGRDLLYSSGTTGRPKGVKAPLNDRSIDDDDSVGQNYAALLRADETTVYLLPAPLYHSAPLHSAFIILSVAGTVVVMDRFDPMEALRLIETHRVTHSQWVPAMFVRMLKLPAEQRGGFELSSHQLAGHGAAPCPLEVKAQMIAWWGPILTEYYGGTENIGACVISSEEWLARPGSVGRSVSGAIHILDDAGRPVPTGEAGRIFFAGGPDFEYLNDPQKTREIEVAGGLRTLGDIGYLDEAGYLFLTDRAADLIISGGVNIYPQEVENLLIIHPKVADAAVIGIPHEELGEEVRAVIQVAPGIEPGRELAEELSAYLRERLSKIKLPRGFDFEPSLPRGDNGKLYKRLLRDRYWAGHARRI